MRKAARSVLSVAVVIAAVSACTDDPLSEGRGEAAYFFTNPSFATVNVNGTTKVTAIVRNRHNAPIGAAVTGTACNDRITVRPDSTRTAFEEPERFVLRGVSVGSSCLIVSGGGIKDTVEVNVIQ